ncbi:MAG: peptide deformylase [Planctomycetes bacterium]|nr:peptide deformylase [Planctomycetota bacterium]
MAVLPIRHLPDPVLRQKAKRIRGIDASIQELIDDMIETMHAELGVGLAANQVGSLQKVAVIQLPDWDEPLVLINPEIVKQEGEREVVEGCLSIPGYRGTVKRSVSVRARALGLDGKVIRIMTIHNAKGLEFPLVVVPDLERRTRSGDSNPVFDERLGPLVPAAEKATVGLDLYRSTQRDEDLEERKRLLYVACTRAADYLILSSSVDDLDKPKSDWLRLLAERFDLHNGQCLAKLPDDYGLPQVRVIAEEPEIERKLSGKSYGADLTKLAEKTRQLAAAGKGEVPDSVRPIPADTGARRRFSFSRLSGQLALEKSTPTPADGVFEKPEALDPLGLGTLIHAVLERIDFTAENDTADGDVEGLCRFLAPLHLETDWQEAAATATRLVGDFLRGPRAIEIAQARTVHREVEFVLPWPPTTNGAAERYLHGYIDCLYQDAAGGWHVVDYKSNQVTAEGVPNAAGPYRLQMYVYRLACEQALGIRPVESVLYFLRPQAEFACDFDDGQSLELSTQLTRAIDAQLQTKGLEKETQLN